jgi:prolyl oligopeptidase
MTRLSRMLASALLALGCASPSTADDISTPVVDVTDVYHGVTVRDPYRWLEDAAAPQVQAWTEAQNRKTRAYLDALASRAGIKARLDSLVAKSSVSFYAFQARGERVFAIRYDPAKQQPMLVVLDATLDPASHKVLLDPNVLDAQGTTTIDWYKSSPDGRIVAVSLSRHGSEIGALRLYETATGQAVGEPIPRVQAPTAGGSLAWTSDGAAFWYTRYPGEERAPADRFFYQQVYFHKLGADWRDDPLVLGTTHGLPRVAEIFLGSGKIGNTALAKVQNGDGGDYAHYAMTPHGVVQLAAFGDKIVDVAAGPDGAIYALSRAKAPNGKILKLKPPFAPLSLPGADVIVPESDTVIQLGAALAVTPLHLMVRDIVGGPSQVRIFDHSGAFRGMLPLPEAASVGEIVPLPDGGALYAVRTYLRPRYVARWDAATGTSQEMPLADQAAYGFDDVEMVRESALSKDGTKVPMNIIRKRGTVLDGSNPTILYGYGGYGVSQRPRFLGARSRLWFDGGGVYAIAIVRGGGEFGERWHLDGNLTRKQNVFDDFAAAARHLIARKYTSSARLAIFGESNGGLLMGATLTQNPDLARAVVARVGIYDMLRVELAPNGEFNVTEFGTVKDTQQFKALYAFSPYHHVRPGVRYPAVLMTTGQNDGRVDPMQSRKFAAALQAATASGLPVLLRTSASGHGQGSSRNERIEEDADILAFLYDQLGLTWRDPASAPSRQ